MPPVGKPRKTIPAPKPRKPPPNRLSFDASVGKEKTRAESPFWTALDMGQIKTNGDKEKAAKEKVFCRP